MKKSVLIIGLVLIMAGIANAQVQRTYSKIVAKGSTSTPFGNYVIKVADEPVILAGAVQLTIELSEHASRQLGLQRQED